jgi:hypothetical protein
VPFVTPVTGRPRTDIFVNLVHEVASCVHVSNQCFKKSVNLFTAPPTQFHVSASLAVLNVTVFQL